jgi:hypothetical protein
MGALTSVALSDALSDTPLARRHELALRGKRVRAQRTLPWDAFERSEHREAALALAVNLWSGLAAGEYAAIGLFSQIAAGLSFTEAPFDLVHAATEVSTDETRHAELCVRMAKLCGADPAGIRVDAERLHANLAPLVDLEELDFVMLFYAAISETLATGLLTECQRRASDRLSRALFTALLADEVHHARFGWYYVAHRSPRWTLAERQRLADRVAQHIVGIERDFWQGRDAPKGAAESARALGILDSKAQRAAISDVMENEILPALDAVGFGASRAWALRPRGSARRGSAARQA